ncbi:hypothetical protein SAMN04490244_103147 [Tranquillimonas rosea]|uniref:Uncharacterized protein n=1 Tax=Tranquillimonas rosea TaxID=641238 RepID=A0A1H9SD31_9RHOB|nr:hypothetical protein [Tranquillimonas rosea]SER82887.1 hypothetical protein SAMN04490244_103147 [Tranquillimonas rosea]
MSRGPGYLPFVAGIALAGVGFGLRQLRPGALNLPAPAQAPRLPDPADPQDVARQARDGLANVMPDNLNDSFGRTLMIMGAGLILLRALDEIVDEDDARY